MSHTINKTALKRMCAERFMDFIRCEFVGQFSFLRYERWIPEKMTCAEFCLKSSSEDILLEMERRFKNNTLQEFYEFLDRTVLPVLLAACYTPLPLIDHTNGEALETMQ